MSVDREPVPNQKPEIFSRETRDLMQKAVAGLREDYYKLEILELCTMPTCQEAVGYMFNRIDWTSSDSVRPHVKLLEKIVRFCPETIFNVPRKLRESLERDGFRIDQRGRFVKR